MCKKITLFISILLLCNTYTSYAQKDDFFKVAKGTKRITENRLHGILQLDLIYNLQAESIYNFTHSGSSKSYGIRFNAIGTYELIPRFLNLGVGLAFDTNKNPDFSSVPAFIDLRIQIPANEHAAYLLFDYGRMIKLQNSFKDGLFYKLGIGVKVGINDETSLLFELSYSVKDINPSNNQPGFDTEETAISFGILF